ncbi:MAG: hypothetical protein M1375_01235 [Candidatus Thermoplasmatota archaeon]|nr:hypothetical protein [Candidatus Thermoplasmatota archaeon]
MVSHTLLPPDVFGFSQFTVYLILILIGLALTFRGKTSWKYITVALGAYMGFVITAILMVRLHVTGAPDILILAIGAVLGGVIFSFLAELAVCVALGGGIAIGVYVFTPAGIVFAALLGIVVIAISYIRFEKISLYVAAFAGGLAIWFALFGMGLSNIGSQVFAAAIMISGIILQKYEEGMEKHPSKPRRPGNNSSIDDEY